MSALWRYCNLVCALWVPVTIAYSVSKNCGSDASKGVCIGAGKQSKSLAKFANMTVSQCCEACNQREACAAWCHYQLHGHPECNLLSGKGMQKAGNCTSSPVYAPPPPHGAKNVLYINVDDLRTQLGSYGHKTSITPNIDKLASNGARFTHAYVQQAVCAPSRGSFMSGLRPDTLRLWTFRGSFRTSHPDWISLPQHFKDSGYAPVLGGGKTFHPGRPPNWDEPRSWTQELPYFSFFEPGCPFNHTLEPAANGYTHSVCPLDGPLDQFFDHQVANFSIGVLRLAKKQQDAARQGRVAHGGDGLVRPFFLAVGFRRPHLPWQMPTKFWNMFNDDSLPPPGHPNIPQDMPPVAWTCGDRCSWELQNRSTYNFTISQPTSQALAKLLRRAYVASMAFMDSEIGRVLDELDALGFVDDTLVILHGDHGWGLGEGNFWHKFSNMEHSVRVPLIIRAPWLGSAAFNRTVPDLVELVSLFPTMAALAGSPSPVFSNGSALPLDGADFSRVLLARNASLDTRFAYSQFPRCDGGNTFQAAHNYCKSSSAADMDWMGYSVRDTRFRYTRWLKWDGDALRGRWDLTPEGEELYDHAGDDGSDFDKFPVGWRNLVDDADYTQDKNRLATALRAFFDK